MKIFKAIAGITAIFILGAMTGVLGTSLVIKHRIEMFHKKGPPQIKAMFMKRISDRLDLNPKQIESIGKILDNLQVELKDIRQDVRPKIKAAFDSSFEQIREQLTEVQKTQFDSFLKELPENFPRLRHFRHKEWHKRNHQDLKNPEKKPFYPDSKNF